MPDASPAPSSPIAAGFTRRDVARIIFGAMTVLFLAALDQTIVATALPTIGTQLGRFELISWVVTAYLLTSTCATPLIGKLSDLRGRRPAMRLCIAVFLLGSVACALAEDMVTLIAARAVQGLGGGGLITLSQTIVADVISPRERGRYGGYFAGVWAAAAVLGPTLGGLLTEYLSWHWIFWINLPVGLVALLATDRILGRMPVHGGRRGLDYASVLLFTVGTTSLLLLLSLGGISMAWLSWQSGAALALFLACWTVFVLRQGRVADPFIPLRFLADGVLRPVLAGIFLIFGAYLAVAVLAPTYFQVAHHSPASEVGLLMIPLMVAGTMTAFVTGRWVTRTGRYRSPPLIGLPIAIATMVVLGLVADRATAWQVSGLLFLAGLGIGPIFPIAVVAAQNAVARSEIGAVSGVVSLSRALGGAVVTAAGTALVLGLLAAWLPGLGDLGGIEDLGRRRLAEPERQAVAEAFSVLFHAVAAVLALGTLVFSRIEQRALRQQG